FAAMPQSAKRKRLGIYYTPPELTSRIVEYTVGELIAERWSEAAAAQGASRAAARRDELPDTRDFWLAAVAELRRLKIVDPACGSGAFLFQAYNVLEHRYAEAIGHLARLGDPDAEDLERQIPQFILCENLYGVDLSAEAVEITQLALWIRSAAPGQTLATLSANIVHGNSLVHDPAVHPAGFDWRARFPDVFDRDEPGFDCVIGNPPWERIKLQEREFFSLPAPEIATAPNAARRRTMVAKLETANPALYERYRQAQQDAGTLLDYCRTAGAYPLTGCGDINTYAVFAELASKLVAPRGRVGLLVPSGIASDKTTKDFFASLAEADRLIRLYDFENRTKKFFPDVDGRFKFCILNFGGDAVRCAAAEFAFFIHRIEQLDEPGRLIPLSGEDIKLLNPNTRTCPIFRTRRDAEITKAVYRRVPVLIDHNRTGPTGNPWGVRFKRMFDQTNDAERFHDAADLGAKGYRREGNRFVTGRGKSKRVYLPVYEAKMVQMYDHRAADVITAEANWMRQGQTRKTTAVEHANPEHLPAPRFWVASDDVEAATEVAPSHFLCFKDVTSPTNQRTMIAAMTPPAGMLNSAPIVFTDVPPRREACLLANLNSHAYDFVMRQKVGNVHLNFFIVEQGPVLPPDTYDRPCPWAPELTLEAWISERVLQLTCTSEDMLPLADACAFTSGSFQREYAGRLHRWDPADRAHLMAQLDAAYFLLYGLTRDDAEYMLSTFQGIHEPAPLLGEAGSTADRILRELDGLMAAIVGSPKDK
ncbi:MAG: N-6 DNA methylase, partial [Thermoguttaceae bacterium]|nr:N-6 DNA methylase [Thermoguttaceae bacterium]